MCVCERQTDRHSHSCAVVHLQMFGRFNHCVVFTAVLVLGCFLAALVFLLIASSVRIKKRTNYPFCKVVQLHWGDRRVHMSVFLLLLEQFLEGVPEASFVLLPTPLCEGAVVVLLRPSPPL